MRNRTRTVAGTCALLFTAGLGLTAAGPMQADDTVTVWGNAYAFQFAGDRTLLEGATIRVVEYPGLSTTAGRNGAYRLDVPDHASVTLSLDYPGYYPTTLQTFHTQGKDLRHVNFQVPSLPIFRAMAGIVDAEIDPRTGLLAKCAIVSTFFEVKGRTLNSFLAFHDFHPHGVPGSTATQAPRSGRQFYFNNDVIPDPHQDVSSRDGGVLWADVAAGTYHVTGTNPDARFASFEATCAPGRLVNANPPWGLYQLADNETTNPAALPDTRVLARQLTAKVKRSGPGPKRLLKLKLKASEHVTVTVRAKQRKGHHKGHGAQSWTFGFAPGKRVVARTIRHGFRAGVPLRVEVALTDRSDNTVTSTAWLAVPTRHA